MIKGTVTRDEDENTRLDCITQSVESAWGCIRRLAQGLPFAILTSKMLMSGEDIVMPEDTPLVLFAHVNNYPYYFDLSYIQANGLPGLCILTVLVEPTHHDNAATNRCEFNAREPETVSAAAGSAMRVRRAGIPSQPSGRACGVYGVRPTGKG